MIYLPQINVNGKTQEGLYVNCTSNQSNLRAVPLI